MRASPSHPLLATLSSEARARSLGVAATELLLTPLPHADSAEDAAKCQNMQLAPVPPAVEAELRAYKAFRQSDFNRFREGAPVVSVTVDSDAANALRWLGFVKTQYGAAFGAPSLKLFAHERVGEWTQAWLEKLRALGLKASTLAVYTNGVIAVCGYALTLVDQPDACPTEQLINLRRAPPPRAKPACRE